MPISIDVEVGYLLQAMLPDLLILMHAYGNLGDLCSHVFRFYLFDNDELTLQHDINFYKQFADENTVLHFEEYYGNQPLIVQSVFARLCLEIKRRQDSGLGVKDKVYADLLGSLYNIAKKLKTDPLNFLTTRFYPFVAKWRNRRLRQFYKAYTSKILPK